MTMLDFEALRKSLYYSRADPLNPADIENASLQEREGFGTGIDPQELPEVIAFIAEHGHVWLQYTDDEGQKTPTGVIELIPLTEALKLRPLEIKAGFDINSSPLVVITGNQGQAFADARRFADDNNIVYHHGIAMSRRGKGYGTLLLRHALDNTPGLTNRFIPCYIDAAQMDEETGRLKPAANESSYTVHMKAGFVLTGVVEPPVYDDSITYYSVLRPDGSKPFKYGTKKHKLKFDDPNVANTIADVRELTSTGFVGVAYDKKSHEMIFNQVG